MGLTMASPSQAAVPPTLKAQLESGGFQLLEVGPQTGTAPISCGTTRTDSTPLPYRALDWVRPGTARR